MKRFFLVLAFVGILVACSPGSSLGLTQPVSHLSDHCAKLVVTDIASNTAEGSWNCLALPAQADYFTRLGWTDDASVGRWMVGHFGSTRQHVDTFYANPVRVCGNTDNSGNCVQWKTEYLYRLSIIQDDGSWDATGQQAAGLTIVVNAQGKVLEID